MPTPWHVPAYQDTLSDALVAALAAEAIPVDGVPGLAIHASIAHACPQVQTLDALRVMVDVYREVKDHLAQILARRAADRAFLDAATLDLVQANRGVPYLSSDYRTVIGLADADGRVLVGPTAPPARLDPVDLPAHLAGPAVTLFGPPDSAKMCINAMNALHRRLPDEPTIIDELARAAGVTAKWGADSEDSKTPFVGDLLTANANLRRCYDRTLAYTDPRTGKHYALATHDLSVPIKRIPGLAIPDGLHLVDGNPLPLHLVDLVLHAVHCRHHPEAMSLYVPKLENEEEAAYVRHLVAATEERLAALPGDYAVGTMRLFIVFETPRAVFRIQQIAQALHPYFAGGSLGWHDFLGFTARLFRHDPNYRIPVKADPNIVIHHIAESHRRLARHLAPIGAVRIGGMYGTLFTDGDPASFEVSMAGYVKDVVTQLRRGLNGFWVAHPDFVRVGLALVEAWRRQEAGDTEVLPTLVRALLRDPAEQKAVLDFLAAPDVPAHDESDPLYPRHLLAADITESAVVSNSDPEEVRYNVFQALQYLASWLSGVGCVALPATLRDADGDDVFVRVMDDLATTERSRWELWAEVHHGRVARETFDRILDEELAFIREGRATPTKRTQVAWAGDAARWYPVAASLLRQLVTDDDPVESVTELLLPFTFDVIRDAPNPLQRAHELCPGRYRL